MCGKMLPRNRCDGLHARGAHGPLVRALRARERVEEPRRLARREPLEREHVALPKKTTDLPSVSKN